MIKLTAMYLSGQWHYAMLSINDFEDLVFMGWNEPDGSIFAGIFKGETRIVKGFYYEQTKSATIFQL